MINAKMEKKLEYQKQDSTIKYLKEKKLTATWIMQKTGNTSEKGLFLILFDYYF